ncbi:hypothetical protein HYH03_000910 [Edaphochlamys debaryana]|uniref:Serine-threonine/tyrosine-protein kinase catalytic domain-containing protein n=1 Tax=Edaphochlamys debaryana TaxID=47281 RepID=A0A835YDT8_9CHLO|nr:hypothetical protein HYH03_000910 [Edaphochlamys debaryana]|eukprot:KAG2501092.1 hypothetical protein HYH03_000910 [Edaphochlamys debaryana]
METSLDKLLYGSGTGEGATGGSLLPLYLVLHVASEVAKGLHTCFGVLLCEMLAGAVPWAGMGPVPIAVQVTMRNGRLPMPPWEAPGGCPSRWPAKMIRLIDSCWDRDPRRRPAAEEVVKALHLIKTRMQMDGILPPDGIPEAEL